MPAPASAAPYAIAATLVGISLSSFITPRFEYGRYGLPLDGLSAPSSSPSHSSTSTPKPTSDDTRTTAARSGDDEGIVSPLMYIKGMREMSYGLMLAALQYRGNEAAITTLHAVLALTAAGDGVLVWVHGGERLRHKALGHLSAGAALGWWAWTRAKAGLV